MTVTVADDSMDNVSITVNDSIVDIAGNPLIEVTDSQDCRHDESVYAVTDAEIKSQ